MFKQPQQNHLNTANNNISNDGDTETTAPSHSTQFINNDNNNLIINELNDDNDILNDKYNDDFNDILSPQIFPSSIDNQSNIQSNFNDNNSNYPLSASMELTNSFSLISWKSLDSSFNNININQNNNQNSIQNNQNNQNTFTFNNNIINNLNNLNIFNIHNDSTKSNSILSSSDNELDTHSINNSINHNPINQNPTYHNPIHHNSNPNNANNTNTNINKYINKNTINHKNSIDSIQNNSNDSDDSETFDINLNPPLLSTKQLLSKFNIASENNTNDNSISTVKQLPTLTKNSPANTPNDSPKNSLTLNQNANNNNLNPSQQASSYLKDSLSKSRRKSSFVMPKLSLQNSSLIRNHKKKKLIKICLVGEKPILINIQNNLLNLINDSTNNKSTNNDNININISNDDYTLNFTNLNHSIDLILLVFDKFNGLYSKDLFNVIAKYNKPIIPIIYLINSINTGYINDSYNNVSNDFQYNDTTLLNILQNFNLKINTLPIILKTNQDYSNLLNDILITFNNQLDINNNNKFYVNKNHNSNLNLNFQSDNDEDDSDANNNKNFNVDINGNGDDYDLVENERELIQQMASDWTQSLIFSDSKSSNADPNVSRSKNKSKNTRNNLKNKNKFKPYSSFTANKNSNHDLNQHHVFKSNFTLNPNIIISNNNVNSKKKSASKKSLKNSLIDNLDPLSLDQNLVDLALKIGTGFGVIGFLLLIYYIKDVNQSLKDNLKSSPSLNNKEIILPSKKNSILEHIITFASSLATTSSSSSSSVSPDLVSNSNSYFNTQFISNYYVDLNNLKSLIIVSTQNIIYKTKDLILTFFYKFAFYC
ncbi:uncharacterized protein ASCRUDRAFT_75858 [Ascoidea rubescens DSM 1968]|uniref:Uncharacterized protein n=1 Tax=Ascoidea rubescens DSM 1968 TaxID=1344418 RepID=A0A1D2VHR2_9ASCO|nr:hypothetical protein ASCRUDRAFT_75858 [Ascoidea rubescens DSM 1968]ODV61139.1 hypothetical protein ASCRUDRAFT_75858 [Ascoidea rubescens DSM 1968]